MLVAAAHRVQQQGEQDRGEDQVDDDADRRGGAAEQVQQPQDVEPGDYHSSPVPGLFLIGDPQAGEDGGDGEQAQETGAQQHVEQPERRVYVQQDGGHVKRLRLALVDPSGVGH
jgi:hypothetical protein